MESGYDKLEIIELSVLVKINMIDDENDKDVWTHTIT